MFRKLTTEALRDVGGSRLSGSRNGGARAARAGRLTFEPLEPRMVLGAGPLFISEFLAVGDVGLLDEDGAASDWIEIHNPGTADVDLDGWHLTDDSDDPVKWEFPAMTLDAGGFLAVFASGKDRTDPESPLHTDFRLGGDEYLALVRPDGGTISHEFVPEYPQQHEGFSYGLSQEITPLLSEGAGLSFLVPDDAGLGTTWTDPDFDASSWSGMPYGSPVLITETGPGGTDWLEIQNVSNYPVDTSDWVILVNNEQEQNINDFDQCRFEELDEFVSTPGTLQPREALYVTDEYNDHHFGTNIFWRAWDYPGQGWVMIVDGEGNVVDFVVWGEPELNEDYYSETAIASLSIPLNGHTVTLGDAWSGPAVPTAGDLNPDDYSLKRTGASDHDNASDFAYSMPAYDQYNPSLGSQGKQNAGLSVPFPGTAPPARTGLGYSTDTPGFEVTFYKANGPISDLAAAEAIVADPARQTYTETETAPVINYWNTEGRGHYQSDAWFPSTTGGVDMDHFVIEASATVIIPEAGLWAFGVNSDDGFGLELTNGADTYRTSYTQNRGPGDTIDTFDVLEPGSYNLRLVAWENESGAEVELFAAKGSRTAFDSTYFDLVGDTARGGLAVTGFGGAIGADVEAEMRGQNSSIYARIPFNVDASAQFDALTLRMKYSDGFVAYLNGREVARRNAPASPQWNSAATAQPPLQAALEFEDINVSDFVSELRAGENVLAVHGLSSAVNASRFFVLPEIVGIKLHPDEERFFAVPTPGTYNTEGQLGFVADTKFSVDRGVYSAQQVVAITTETPGATIRYTFDGSEPTGTNGTVYTRPIPIRQTSTLRAAAFKEGYWPTDVDTHTYVFVNDVIRQSANGQRPTADWPSGSVNGQSINYGMDPDIVNNAAWSPKIRDALLSLPTMSLVTDLDNLFDSQTGIYVNATNDGKAWERPASLELIYPPGAEGPGFPDGVDEGFQIDAGVRIRGGYSRQDSNPKHAFRFFFRDEYGDAKLEYPLFGDEGTDRFDKVDLRTSQNYSWAFGGPNNNTMVRDVFSRDVQGEMGQPYTRSRYYHLYINGYYWGVFQTQERSEARYAASYYGGDSDDWDVIKQDDSRYVSATDGNEDAYTRLWQTASAGYRSNTAYFRAQGMNPDGTRNPAYERLLDVDNLIDYMIITYYTGDRDGPGSRYTTPRPNNYWAAYNREDPDGWKFFEHDSEHSLGTGDNNMVEPLVSNNSDRRQYRNFNAHWLHEQLMYNAEYKQQFMDRVYQHFHNDGVLTYENSLARINYRADQIDLAMIAESARWGDTKTHPPRNYNHWVTDVNEVRSWIINRTSNVEGQLRQVRSTQGGPYYSSISPPTLSQHGGEVPVGYGLRLSGGGTIYYMLDGSDPRMIGGRLNPAAVGYTGSPIALTESTVVQARTRSGTSWSPLAEAQFYVGESAAAGNLAITELNYNPYEPTAGFEGKDFEFVELQNTSNSIIDLTDVQFVQGITFDFNDGEVTRLVPGEFVVIVRNLDAFTTRYGDGINVAGVYDGSLSNSGERIWLKDRSDETILEFVYGDGNTDGWPGRSDGTGSTLEMVDPAGDYDLADNWRSSSEYGGSPGSTGTGPRTDVVVNEVLAHTDDPDEDAIELHNATGQAIDVSGWYLSDTNDDFRKFTIPDDTVIPAGGYVVFYEHEFNTDPENVDFALNGAHGDDVWLLQPDEQDRLKSFVQHVEFGAAKNGESFGRWPNAQGALYPMSQVSLGRDNSGPRVGPVMISEVMFHPVGPEGAADPGEFEYVEIFNPTDKAIDLAHWRLRGAADYDFETGMPLEPNAVVVVVPFDPGDAGKADVFRAYYEINDPEVVLVGPYSDRFGDDGGSVRLHRPDQPPPDELAFYPRLLEDEVIYGDVDPWPTTPDGGGKSLHRAGVLLWGNDATNWTAGDPTPGAVELPPLYPGDANLDDRTDVRDFNIWNAHKFTRGTSWITGDFNGDGRTDVRDFNIWNAHKFTAAPTPPPVDAILEEAAEQPAMLEDALLKSLAWLPDFEEPSTARRTTRDDSSTGAIVDKLLASYWP